MGKTLLDDTEIEPNCQAAKAFLHYETALSRCERHGLLQSSHLVDCRLGRSKLAANLGIIPDDLY
jgi:hypothetical protein